MPLSVAVVAKTPPSGTCPKPRDRPRLRSARSRQDPHIDPAPVATGVGRSVVPTLPLRRVPSANGRVTVRDGHRTIGPTGSLTAPSTEGLGGTGFLISGAFASDTTPRRCRHVWHATVPVRSQSTSRASTSSPASSTRWTPILRSTPTNEPPTRRSIGLFGRSKPGSDVDCARRSRNC